MQTVPDEDGAAWSGGQGRGWDRQRWDRAAVAAKVEMYFAAEGSERQRAVAVEVPRATMRSWLNDRSDETDATGRYFETLAGLAQLQRIVLAAFITITLMGTGGIRMVQMFLRLSGLSQYVASSYGALHSYGKQVEQALMAFDDTERPRLAEQMRAKLLTVCLDETFHPAICLVGMEPVSGYILVEQYSPKRDAVSWNAAMSEGLRGLNVDVVQVTSDEAKAIIHYVEHNLDAIHSPDVFHVQHEVSKGVAAPLSAQVRAAEKQVQEASEQVAAAEALQRKDAEQPRGPGRPPDHVARIQVARGQQHAAGERLAASMGHQRGMAEVNRGIAQAYHPFDLTTGAQRGRETVEGALRALFATARDIAAKTALPERCLHAINKAAAVVEDMARTVAFFHRVVGMQVADMPISSALQQALLTLLIPAMYLQTVARKAPRAARRHELGAAAATLLERLKQLTEWTALDAGAAARLMHVATEHAQLFQRSSSCVEGRNGRLALHHHGIHRLRPDRLRCLTIIHNYFIQRPDRSTAAERFFDRKPLDLFQWLVDHGPPLPKPAETRAQATRVYDA